MHLVQADHLAYALCPVQSPVSVPRRPPMPLRPECPVPGAPTASAWQPCQRQWPHG